MTFVVDDNRSPDKMRLCPSCRMQISVLATKCRYCGEEVGRPKEEQRQLTIESMGGEHIEHYAPSSSVMEALESFRSEEVTDKAVNATRRSLIFRRKPGPKASAGKGGGLPELDAQSLQLAGGGQGRTVSSRIVRGSAKPRRGVSSSDLTRWAGYAAIAIAALLVLYYGGGVAIRAVKAMRTMDTPAIVSSANPAVRMLEAGEPIMAVLTQASLYHRKNDTPESEAVLNDVRARVVEEVRGLLDADPFDRRNLRSALRMANEANQADPNSVFTDLKREVDEEHRVYATMLLDATADTSPPVAVFRITDASKRNVDVQAAQGETFLDGRFRIDLVRPNVVHLIDLERGDRRLRARKLSEITSP